MKTFFSREKARQVWASVMASTRRNMSRGAQSVNRIITWARGDGWRNNRESKK